MIIKFCLQVLRNFYLNKKKLIFPKSDENFKIKKMHFEKIVPKTIEHH